MLMDLAVKDWMEKIHLALIDRVKIDYGVQIKAGMRLSQLAPQIAKAIPSILKKLGNTKNEVIRALQDLDHNATEHSNPVYSMQYKRGGGYRSRGQNRPQSIREGRGAQNNSRNRNMPTCKHCKWLHDHWDIREIDYSHDTKSCRRTMPPEVKFINKAPSEEHWHQQEEEGNEYYKDDDAAEGQPPYKIIVENNSLLFQKTKAAKRCTAEEATGDIKHLEQTPDKAKALTTDSSQPISVSETSIEMLRT